jgi:predicted transcriptional regulator
MRIETVHYFTSKEQEFVDLLTEIGTSKNVANILVFLANVPQATSRDIERGTGLRQPDVSTAVKELMVKSWVREETINAGRGRPNKFFELAMPMTGIVQVLEEEKKAAAKAQLELLGRIREFSQSTSPEVRISDEPPAGALKARMPLIEFTPEEEAAFIRLLNLGIKERPATVVSFLTRVPKSSIRDISNATGLSEPSVVTALLDLKAKGWIGHKRIVEGNIRRKVYSMSVSVKDIIYLLGKENLAQGR